MLEEEVYQRLKKEADGHAIGSEARYLMERAVEYVELQIPSKPVKVLEGYRCPHCDALLLRTERHADYSESWCDCCGSKISWE